MRIYDGSPRQDFEEILRAIGAHLDAQGMREILFLESDDGLIVQGLAIQSAKGAWSNAVGQLAKETIVIREDTISAYLDEAMARRGKPAEPGARTYESALRVIGRFLDERHPRDVFFFEQDGAFVLRLLKVDQAGPRHELVEFTADDIAELVAQGPTRRQPRKP